MLVIDVVNIEHKKVLVAVLMTHFYLMVGHVFRESVRG